MSVAFLFLATGIEPISIEVVLKLVGWIAGVAGSCAWIMYATKGLSKDLAEHIEDDRKAFGALNSKADQIVEGINTITATLATHQTSLSLHDERTKRTAESIRDMHETITAIDGKVSDLRLNQERIGGKLDIELK